MVMGLLLIQKKQLQLLRSSKKPMPNISKICFLYMVRKYSDWIGAGRSGDRIPVGSRFSVPVQTDPGAHPASYIMCTGSFMGVKRLGSGVGHPPHLAPRLKKK